MNICIVSPYDVFPLTSGSPRRVFEIAKGLNLHGASVVVLHPGQSKAINADLDFIGFKHFTRLFVPKKFKWSSALGTYMNPLNFLVLSKLMKIASRYDVDVIQCEQSWSVPWAILVANKYHVPLTLDEHGVDAIAVRHSSSIPYAYPYTLVLEKYATNTASSVFVVSEEDRKKLIDLYNVPISKVTVIANGVNTDEYNSVTKTYARRKLGFKDDEILILFHGILGWKANHEAAMTITRTIAPEVHKHLPNVKFLIVGARPSQNLIKQAQRNSHILLARYVPNLVDYIVAADVCIVPLHSGSGTRLKLLEYMAASKPIVTTTIGAEGIPLCNSVHAMIHKEVDESFIESIKQLILNKRLAEEMGAHAKKLAESFDWKVITTKLYEQYLKF